jgi:predicted CoA-substrate-specific enzyme activase
MGIDIGSVSTEAVIVNDKKEIIEYIILPSGYNHRQTAEEIIKAVCDKAAINKCDLKRIFGTGYGRRNIPGTYKTVTEITCHTIGVRHLYQDANIIIDIGGQDSKVIWLAENGFVENFIMNDKCSAGTGRFLEVMAGIMKMDMQEFSSWGLKAERIYPISSTCTVFAESEVISGISAGIPSEEIIAGIYQSITERILTLAGILKESSNEIILTGGVAKNLGVVEFIKKRVPGIKIPFEPQITGALGAALLAGYDE